MSTRNRSGVKVVVTMLGTCSVTVGNRVVASVPAAFFRIAAYLLLSEPSHSVSRQKLAELFWPHAAACQASSNLRQSLARIRRLQDECGFQLIDGNFRWFTWFRLP
ncbi:MAG: hypothetical protein HC788_11670 [Sphingopyxis sp.]|nr:hypothetical protein [Sphingopyxis sp.]